MRLLHLYAAVFGWRVRGGPFRGMRYVHDSICSTLAPKLLGTYERELTDWVEQLLARKFAVVLNVGAAEGYYAVGFALRCPGSRVVAFEGDAPGRALTAELASCNGVADRIAVEGFCTPESLAPYLVGPAMPLLIVDIEGGEVELLDPEKLPALRHCTMLVELHEEHQPAGEMMHRRFAATHAIGERKTQPRSLRDLPLVLRWLAQTAARSRFLSGLDEHRPGPMRWFLLEPVTKTQ